jgi:para-nitrobenzyl esterase
MKRIVKKALSFLLVLSMVFAFCNVNLANAAASSQNVTSDTISQKTIGTNIKTEYGKVHGLQSGDAITWYGIPYAAEPVGALRWSKPQDPKNWTKTLDCTKKEAVALQYSASSKTVVGSTNCLNLDVYAPVTGSNLPVYVFFHGGNNQTGSSLDLNGRNMVIMDNCIVVSVNYRLGLLGFNCLPALQTEKDSSGNYGLYDMQKSLQWVKDNIKRFGGNPNNVTVAGSSAGGRDVMVMLISPLFTGLFQKAFTISGGMTTADEDKSASQISSFLAPLAVKYGKAATTAEAQTWLLTTGNDVKEFLYSLTSEELMELVKDAGIRMSAFPHLYADGVSIPKEGFSTSKYNNVPIIMTTGSDEFSFFNNGLAYTDGSIEPSELSNAKAFGSKYGSLMYDYFNAGESAQSMTATGYKSNIYLLNCNFGHNTAIWTDMPMGSVHTIVGSFLNMSDGLRFYFPTAFKTNGATELTTLTNNYVRNFLWSETGNPNSAGNTTWVPYTSKKSVWMVLDANRDIAYATMVKIKTTNYDAIFTEMDNDKTISDSAKAAVIKTVLNGRWFSTSLDQRYGNDNLWK